MKMPNFFLNTFNLFLLICFAANQASAKESPPSSDYEVNPNQTTLPILTPDLSERKVLKLKLANGLEAHIISDPKADKSGAVLTVDVGSWNDPREYPGLAHFLEHMLFLGTEKYPEESGYQHYISENGGTTNAFTSTTKTAFLFAVNNAAFEEALDRFSQFFQHPLFNPSGVSRELQAIDQEYATHLDNDDMRLFMVDKELSNPNHPYSIFSIGNSKTLSTVSQETLKNWYKEHYSANLMHLVIYSSLPIEQLQNLVVNDFKEIPNNNKQILTTSEPIVNPPEHLRMIYIDSIKNSRTLTLLWDLPDGFAQMLEEQPGVILCHVLGHEGPESLLASLKKEKLADKLQCGALRLSPQNLEVSLEIELTDKGIANVNEVITRIFEALAVLREKNIPSYLFNDIQRMAKINYQYQSREETFQAMVKHATWLGYEALSTYPEQTLVVQKFDPKKIAALLQELTPESSRFYVTAPVSITNITPDHTEKWMGAQYAMRNIDQHLIDKWKNSPTNAQIDLPAPNQFIPLKLKNPEPSPPAPPISVEDLIPTPTLLIDDKSGKIYFAQDKRFNMPQICWLFELKTPEVEMGSATKTILADLYVKSVTEALNEVSYPALLAGLTYEVKRKDYGIAFRVQGYSENAELFFDEIIKQLKYVRPTEAQFEIYRQALQRDYQNFLKRSPLEQAAEYLKSILYKKFTTAKQKTIAINRISFDKFNEYLDRLFSQVYVEAMLYGDNKEPQVKKIIDKLFTTLDGSVYPKATSKRPQVIVLSNKQGPLYWEVSTKAQGNAVILAMECPTFSFKERAAQQILMQALEQPFFSTLRTKQQTGYVVYSDDREIERQLFNFFAVQSSTHSVRDLLARFELFIESFLQEFSHELPKERFEHLKQAILTELKQPAKNIKEMAEILQQLAFEYQGDFKWVVKRIKGMEELSYDEFVAMSKECIGRGNKRRLAILLKGNQSADNAFNYSPVGNLLKLRKTSAYSAENLLKPSED